jgi:2-C-methyl-D-erythritol 4-phosphate cytidylyltransferase
MTAAIVLAGGTSERLSSQNIPKQYIKVLDKPVFIYCLMQFEICKDIDIVAFVAADNMHEEIKRYLAEYEIKKVKVFASPGKTRQHSMYNGLNALKEILKNEDLVVIHDAARPLVTANDITASVEAASSCDGATPFMPIKDTIYSSIDGKYISSLINRDELRAGQTPECYNYVKYLNAFDNLTDDEIVKIRGSSEVAFMNGMKIRLFPGNPRNIKITDENDLDYFKYLVGRDE